MKNRFPLVLFAGAILLLAALLAPMYNMPQASAAPQALVTPVSVTHSGVRGDVVTLFNGDVLTTTGGGTRQAILDHAKVDLQWVIDQGSTPNTATLKLQFSNDGTNWVDGSTFVTSNSADAGDMQQYPVYGRYMRAYATLGNNEDVTLTVIGVVK